MQIVEYDFALKKIITVVRPFMSITLSHWFYSLTQNCNTFLYSFRFQWLFNLYLFSLSLMFIVEKNSQGMFLGTVLVD